MGYMFRLYRAIFMPSKTTDPILQGSQVHCGIPNAYIVVIVTIRNHTRVGTLIVATIYLQLIQNRYMFRSFTVLQRSHQHCVLVQPVASDVEVVGYL